MIFVYQIDCGASEKSYIGVTSQGLKERWRQHLVDAKSGSPRHFCRALRKYGPDAFEISVRGAFKTGSEAKIAERILISLEKPDYNMTLGGEGTSGLRHTDAAKSKMSAASLGRKHTAEARLKMSQAKLGKPRPASMVKAMSEARKGVPLKPEHKAAVAAAAQLRRVPIEQKRARWAAYARKRRAETKAKRNPCATSAPS